MYCDKSDKLSYTCSAKSLAGSIITASGDRFDDFAFVVRSFLIDDAVMSATVASDIPRASDNIAGYLKFEVSKVNVPPPPLIAMAG